MVRDVLTGGASEEASAESPAPEPQSIDLSVVGSSDGIISSLDDDFSDAAVQYEGAKRPFRCMFVRDQKLKSGQRVTMPFPPLGPPSAAWWEIWLPLCCVPALPLPVQRPERCRFPL